MRIRIRHATTYAYDHPAIGVIQALRVTPVEHEGQRVLNWRVDVDVDGVLRTSRDAFGNQLNLFYAEGPVSELTIRVSGEAEVRDTAGVVRGAPEPLPPATFRRPTPLTTADAGLAAWAAGIDGPDPLSRLHRLMAALHERLEFDSGLCADTPAAEAFDTARGGCQAYAHVFIAATRSLGLPARFVSGHLCRQEAGPEEAAYAWAEAYVPDLGWTGFDAAAGACPDQRYLRVAVGLDYLDAAPLRGARRSGGDERLSVEVAGRASQRQD